MIPVLFMLYMVVAAGVAIDMKRSDMPPIVGLFWFPIIIVASMQTISEYFSHDDSAP